MRDFMHPDRIVVGAFEPRTPTRSRRSTSAIDAPIVRCDVNSAEMIKLAANAFLMTRISFINEIANVCEATGADVVKVAEGVGLDHRLGPHFLRAGIGYGGSLPARRGDGRDLRGRGHALDDARAALRALAGGDREREVVHPSEPLEVFAWPPGDGRGRLLPRRGRVTRRRFEGELARASSTASGRGVRVARPTIRSSSLPRPAARPRSSSRPSWTRTTGCRSCRRGATSASSTRSRRAGARRPQRRGDSVAVAAEDALESAAVDWIVVELGAASSSSRGIPYRGLRLLAGGAGARTRS